MTKEQQLKRHLELCKKVYLRMKREGRWPWPDSPNSNDMLESEDQSNTA